MASLYIHAILRHAPPTFDRRGDRPTRIERIGMSAVAVFDLILFLMAVALLLELLARQLRMPPAAAFILGGGILALIPGVPNIEFDPNLILVLFLPPLLMSSAFFTSWRDFRSDL